MKISPFSADYAEIEIQRYSPFPYDKDGLVIDVCSFKNIPFDIPVFYMDGLITSSLSFMEIQTAFLPIKYAHGRVGVGGIGFGYYLMKIAQKDDVEHITVYENDIRVIEYFMSKFKDAPWFEKIRIVYGDVKESMCDENFDFVYMDIYDSIFSEEMLDDMEVIQANNNIKHYYIWSQELVLLAALDTRLRPVINPEETEFLEDWRNAEQSQKFKGFCEDDFLYNFLHAIGRVNVDTFGGSFLETYQG